MFRPLVVTLVAVALPASVLAQDPQEELEVAEAAVATDVEDREPRGAASNFVADVGALHFWTRITGAEGETSIEHVWSHEGEEVARVTLEVGSPDWRTWSRVTILPERTGTWEVEVLDPDEEVLHSEEFTIQ